MSQSMYIRSIRIIQFNAPPTLVRPAEMISIREVFCSSTVPPLTLLGFFNPEPQTFNQKSQNSRGQAAHDSNV